jgi:hypothetical protein
MADKIYKRITFQGIRVHIDRPTGFVQKGDGWTRTYKNDYGFIPRTEGGDDEEIDVFIADPANENAPTAYVCAQQRRDGTFDEYKLILGANSSDEALRIYTAHIPQELLQRMYEIPVPFLQGILNVKPSTDLYVNAQNPAQTTLPMIGLTESLYVAEAANLLLVVYS